MKILCAQMLADHWAKLGWKRPSCALAPTLISLRMQAPPPMAAQQQECLSLLPVVPQGGAGRSAAAVAVAVLQVLLPSACTGPR